MNHKQIYKNHLILLVIKELEIKGTMKHYFTPVRVAFVKIIQMMVRIRKKEISYTWNKNKIIQP